MRLIDADALKEKIDFIFPYDPLADYEENIGEVIKIIDNAPTIVVRTKIKFEERNNDNGKLQRRKG